MLDRLLQSVYSAFDKGHLGQIALRIYHPDSVVWRVAGRVLSLGNELSGITHTYDLKSRTLQALAEDVNADGYSVIYLDPSVAGLSSAALVAGSGMASISNGDAIYCYRSLLWGILDSIALELEGARDQIPEALRQITMTASEAEYLDLWGYYFDVPRKPGMSDADYREWIVKEVTRLRLSPGAIELAILEHTGFDVTILEPWKFIFTYDESELDGDHRLFDGNLIDYHVIQPKAFTPVDWTVVMPVIHRNRSAGVLVLGPEEITAYHADFSEEFSDAGFLVCRDYCGLAIYEDTVRYDYMLFGDVSVLNHEMGLTQVRMTGGWADDSGYEYPEGHFHATRNYREHTGWVVYSRNTWISLDTTWDNSDMPWQGENDARDGAFESIPAP